MKKVLFCLLAITLALSLCACGANRAEEPATDEPVIDEPSGIANPLTEIESLDKLNELCGTKLTHPGVMGVTDEAFFTIDCGDYTIAEYRFSIGGIPYVLRSAPVNHDISGVYLNGTSAFPDQYKHDEEVVVNAEYHLARWFTMDGQYCLTVKDEGKMADDTFAAILNEFKTLTATGLSDGELEAYYADLAGTYQDSYSQRAMLQATANGKEGLHITVSWGSSAFETSEWTMTAYLSEDGLLSYNDCTSKTIYTAEDGKTTEEILYTNGSGYFVAVDGQLRWQGAQDENCRNCVFEKMPDANQ